ncbi:tetratricopeptide repeat protein [Rhodopila sp.]|uniref:tetratricopeptide repeat protein n=1 Tax=Rhodopila sp. TaxID=2480087 RepID=UPI002C2AE5A2|nr:tetratricopeptide repeat-containing glycosyltransferase family protein [Rhodopila sp.]HVZ06405.1 tetratricopeptide repeat-containing glycosyltransferase family protein [Rhodopila sp.]
MLRLALQALDAGYPSDAERMLHQVLAAAPRDAAALHVLGIIFYQTGRTDAALGWLDKAAAADPRDATIQVSRGNVLAHQGRLDDAVAAYRKALRLQPRLSQAINNLGNALSAQQRPEEARIAYRKALAMHPDDPQAHYNLALLELALGEMPTGWERHEWRWRGALTGQPALADPRPQWRGEAAPGKTLLIRAEQGLGDTLQFCRYAPLAAALGLRVVMQVPASLVRLMHSLDGVVQVAASDDDLPVADLVCPVMSLPLALNTTLDTIPATTPYLRADPVQAASWRTRLATGEGLRVGLVWQGGTAKEPIEAKAIGRRRSIDPCLLAPVIAIPGIRFFSLQKDGVPAPAAFGLTDMMAEVRDFADTAALIEALDLVISIDTSVAHLAGALGKPVWLMDRHVACWRWLRERRDSPWYPTMRIYRQPSLTDWESVMTGIADDLRALATGRSAGVSYAVPPASR